VEEIETHRAATTNVSSTTPFARIAVSKSCSDSSEMSSPKLQLNSVQSEQLLLFRGENSGNIENVTEGVRENSLLHNEPCLLTEEVRGNSAAIHRTTRFPVFRGISK
jgi:hypothetical protein